MTAPYCEHAECHNSHTAYYRDWRGWTSGTNASVRDIRWIKEISFSPLRNARRWCRSHALIFEGVAFG